MTNRLLHGLTIGSFFGITGAALFVHFTEFYPYITYPLISVLGTLAGAGVWHFLAPLLNSKW